MPATVAAPDTGLLWPRPRGLVLISSGPSGMGPRTVLGREHEEAERAVLAPGCRQAG